jgi:hypothetical protein
MKSKDVQSDVRTCVQSWRQLCSDDQPREPGGNLQKPRPMVAFILR